MTPKLVTAAVTLALLLVVGHIADKTEAAEVWGVFHAQKNPGKCAISERLTLSPGESTRDPDKCAEWRCLNEEGHAVVVSCGVAALLHGGEWGEYINPNAKYPDCCEREIKLQNA